MWRRDNDAGFDPKRWRLRSCLLLVGAASLLTAQTPPASEPTAAGAEDRRVALVRRFNALREAKLAEEAAELLAPDPRLWFGERTGEGKPWEIGGETADWYHALHGSTDYLRLERDGDTVVAEALVTDDFNRLLGIEPGLFELRWWFDDRERISGFLVVSKRMGDTTNYGRFFTWAWETHPARLREIAEGLGVIFDAANVPAWIDLLREWRRSDGLPEIELAGSSEDDDP